MTPLPITTFAAETGAMVALLRELAEIESPSLDKAAVDRAGQAMLGHLTALGAQVELDRQRKTGDHLVARWGPAGRSDGMLILVHLDTVYPMGTLARQPVREQDGNLFGPGVYDMKASAVMTLTAIRVLQQTGRMPAKPITALFTSDEEIGSASSRALIEQQARGKDLVLCLEPCLPDGSLKTWRKGIGSFTIQATGFATHAGADHERGVNAIEEIAHQVIALQRMTDYDRGTTVSVGVVRGGTRANVVPEECRAVVDARVMTPAEGERLSRAIHNLQPAVRGARLKITGGLNRPPMPRTPLLAQTFARAQAIAAGLGITVGEGGTGGGSDANFVAPLNVPVLDGLGAQGNGAHSEREHVVIASLPERAALLAALLSEW
jgi:glutamate carboxypeptidase